MALGLTKQERWTILFLMTTGLLGIGILCYRGLADRPRIEVVSGQDMEKEIASARVININTATKQELLKLPGVGPALSEAIIDYRTAHGAFKDKEELRQVGGIGPAKFEKIKERVKTE
ncbi:MAG: helix-hairpin-helix domain-containing protein [Candidatus Omnitrophica bacterium]|nr:helix-hairpin-helix domain-containing protein [Candidatus Omnitrophota bacterium]